MERAIQVNKPCFNEFMNVCLCSAGIESATDAALATADKLLEGKHIREFDSEDYKDIGMQALKGAAKGTVRGATVYAATNFTPIPAPVATAGVTAVFGISSQVTKYKKGKITEEECLHNSSWCVVDASVSAASSMFGTRYISRLFPTKFRAASIVGALIGNAMGTVIYGIIKNKIIGKRFIWGCIIQKSQG